jgi:hypothetical protein
LVISSEDDDNDDDDDDDDEKVPAVKEDVSNEPKGGKKAQLDITAFFNPNTSGKINTVDDLRQAGRQALQKKKKMKKERRIRSTFFDEEAEESDSAGDEDEGTGKDKKKRRKGRIHDSDEEVDEDEIRRELVASKFIVDDPVEEGNDDDDRILVEGIHNRLEMERDATALQAIVDRFARDKLDPNARHLQRLAGKYSTDITIPDDLSDNDAVRSDDEQMEYLLTSSSDDDHINDLIMTDSDLDYSDPEPEPTSNRYVGLSRSSSTLNFAKDDSVLVEQGDGGQPVLRHHGGLAISASLLAKLVGVGGVGGGSGQSQRSTSQGGFTVGNSIIFD